MSKHKQNAVEVNPSETEITKVVAKIVEENHLPAVAEPLSQMTEPFSEVPPEYTAAIKEVQAAFSDYCRSCWRVAWALVDFRTIHERLHPDNELTDKKLAKLLGIKLTPSRIGQLVNTASRYSRDQVDESVDFKVYEIARVKYPRATPEKLLQLVKDHPTTAEMENLKSPGRPKPMKIRQKLVIQVTPPVDEDAEPVVNARLNNANIELTANLLNVISKYANKLFTDGKDDGE